MNLLGLKLETEIPTGPFPIPTIVQCDKNENEGCDPLCNISRHDDLMITKPPQWERC